MNGSTKKQLVFLAGDRARGDLLWEGVPLAPGTILGLVRKRSPWGKSTPDGQSVERVIVGSHPERADVLLCGAGIHAEHVRFYFPSSGPPEVRPLLADSLQVNGKPREALEWITLAGGEELWLGPWLFRYEAR